MLLFMRLPLSAPAANEREKASRDFRSLLDTPFRELLMSAELSRFCTDAFASHLRQK